jgi:hypothetical protein
MLLTVRIMPLIVRRKPSWYSRIGMLGELAGGKLDDHACEVT